ncbi:uncharacterized protein L3040_001960 [Drepanopeziza brunnea f. sp. 'multigermtubi']|uniref:uncharacterized protein n=1 Tax=Drepanopeziza brunnea f. sp. 'multigermtubi' TaxID=698441 RepID=UPI00238EB86A|nr:hypothetical protein L3040_001960 [Drepanopeziza brunnea f. sp. 'multigermtubi']
MVNMANSVNNVSHPQPNPGACIDFGQTADTGSDIAADTKMVVVVHTHHLTIGVTENVGVSGCEWMGSGWEWMRVDVDHEDSG